MDGSSRSVMSAGHNHCCMKPYSEYFRTEPPVSTRSLRQVRRGVNKSQRSNHGTLQLQSRTGTILLNAGANTL